jgi:ribonuclease VapC
MVIDTSALLAILLQEPEARDLAEAIGRDARRLMSAVTLVETGVVMQARKGDAGARELDLAIHRGRIDVVPFTAEQAEAAREGYRRFGKGRHQAGLDFGDCCAYALALTAGEALLYKGTDFGLTDIRSALPQAPKP